ncbi:ABC transporter substrate binding protein [Vibrio paucivorans]|uniref:ABC transporter substrate-binding protein n=1 Tax=Vibrio paucivorans TaxID=2829489 RepID=A0A9X3CC34_9VIBR|nr:ABC transporter substrate binding protein [Vibrio paucivorans]MCW8332976.1 ABC transporter substrate-binding protein [Vibrio paucivorans]
MKKWLTFIVITFACNFMAQASEEKHVVMLLWRGITEAEKGYMSYLSERNSVKFTVLNANRDKATLAAHISSLEEHQADVIYTFGTTITRTLLGTVDNPSPFSLTSSTPVVFSIVTDPVGSRITDSLNSDHRNFTGVSHIVPHNVQLKAISQLPNVDILGIIYNPLENNAVITANNIAALGRKFNIQVNLYPLDIVDEKPSAGSVDIISSKMAEDGVDVAYLPPDSYIIAQGGVIVDSIHNQGIPTFSATESPIRNYDALFGIVSRYYNVGQFAAYKTEQILNESMNISDIPIEALSQYSYIVNINAAKQLDYYPPVSILKISEIIGKQQ